ncbi:MAG: CarD family transcriptional regulator, partial [Planctomycetaceae bacterium]|nr:CarD family transcriptional regulator [Planctomycetaceae bacterium]
MASGETRPATLSDLTPRLAAQAGFAEVVAALHLGRMTSIDGTWGSAAGLTIAALAAAAPATVLVVLPREKELDPFALDVATFAGVAPDIFPAWETLPQELRTSDPILGSRLRVLKGVESASPPKVVVTTIQALLQPVPAKSTRQEATRTWKVGEVLDTESLAEWLVARGFERVPALEMPGEFSIHGGIVDLFSPDAADPVRIELYGDEIDSIRTFDVETQQKVADLPEVRLTFVAPRNEIGQPDDVSVLLSQGESFLASLPSKTWVVLHELEDLQAEARLYLQRLDDRRGLFGIDATFEHCTRHATVFMAGIAASGYETACHLRVTSIERFTRPKQEALDEFAETLAKEDTAFIACHNAGSQERLSELLAESTNGLKDRVQIGVGHVSRGFRLVAERLVVLSDNELFGRTEVVRAPRKRKLESRAIDSFLDLKEGDLIVHLSHGIGRYRGMKLIEKDGQQEEHLQLEFRDSVQLFVPVTLIHLVQKYVGGGKSTPELAKVGGTGWTKKKAKVAEAVSDMAADMLTLQAERDAKP